MYLSSTFVMCVLFFARLSNSMPMDDQTETLLFPHNFARSLRQQEPGTPGKLSNTGPPISADLNPSYWAEFNAKNKPSQPIRGTKLGASILGPTNLNNQNQNADLLAPPSTDHGTVPSSKWPFSSSHNRLSEGGWARQQTVAVLPTATQMAGVNMRLEAGAIRELHWHSASEWAYIIAGSAEITAVDAQGRNFIDTVEAGDDYFPSGDPHSIQAGANGTEFLLVFDNGSFDEDSTFLLTDWLSHTPKGVINTNFGLPADDKAFNDLPSGNGLYIFNAEEPTSEDSKLPDDPYGQVPEPFSYHFSQQSFTEENDGGWVKIADSTNFKASKTIAAAEVMLKPGSIREMHWHPTSDEWSLILSGETRVTIFAASGNAATYNLQAGDVGYIHEQNGHYVECISTEPCHFLEVLKAPRFEDVALAQWLAVIPPKLVEDHLRVSKETVNTFRNKKEAVRFGSLSNDK
ncbi:RmlC-like cupin domain-containing protein [Melampsora americana]|nr:RmlC-like cupin domain-containing protein [Melampsora americana]